MKKLLILSGKGGTGKTSTAGSFIHFARAEACADCDVDAPNLHLVLNLSGEARKKDFYGSEKASIIRENCVNCGKCADFCRFGAIKNERGIYSVDTISCEGCAACTLVCPASAIKLEKDIAGEQELYANPIAFSTAKLKMGRGNSGKLVTAVKNELFQQDLHTDLAVIDGSPGIGCPVIASMNGTDLILIVAEASKSGLSDLKRLAETARGFRTPVCVCVNKWDLNPEYSTVIENYCLSEKIPFMGKIPYDSTVSYAVNQNRCIAEFECAAKNALHQIYLNVRRLLFQDNSNENLHTLG